MNNAFEIRDLNSWFGNKKVLNNINIDILYGGITAIMGPSGCGKSTLLRSINRLNDHISGYKLTGEIKYRDRNVYNLKGKELIDFRKNVTMVFQRPNPSIPSL